MKKRVGLAWVGVAGWLAGTAFAHADSVKLLPGPFEMPDHIGPMYLQGEPHKYPDARLGASYQYFGGGLSLTVYVFDLGATDIPDGGDTRYACEAFEGAKSEVQRAGYSDVRLVSEQLARLDPPADQPTAREAVFEYSRENHPTVSYIWVTGAAKQFVKLRFSVDPKLREELPEARRAILDALGAALKPHLAPMDANAKTQRTALNLHSGDPEEMGTALMYLSALSSDEKEHPEKVPLCGGELVPDFAKELLAIRSALALGGVTGNTKFVKQVADMEKAGFLEEFVWTYRHRDIWGTTPPDGLDLAGFDQWRAKKLKKFKMPDLGNVEFVLPRPLPLEPVSTAP